MICRKTMRECQTPSMCAPFGGCIAKSDPIVEDLKRENAQSRELLLNQAAYIRTLQDENLRLVKLSTQMDGQLGKRPCQNNRCVNYNKQEALIAELAEVTTKFKDRVLERMGGGSPYRRLVNFHWEDFVKPALEKVNGK